MIRYSIAFFIVVEIGCTTSHITLPIPDKDIPQIPLGISLDELTHLLKDTTPVSYEFIERGRSLRGLLDIQVLKILYDDPIKHQFTIKYQNTPMLCVSCLFISSRGPKF